jgi:hypothetical protein
LSKVRPRAGRDAGGWSLFACAYKSGVGEGRTGLGWARSRTVPGRARGAGAKNKRAPRPRFAGLLRPIGEAVEAGAR